jgi:hypothetical protein
MDYENIKNDSAEQGESFAKLLEKSGANLEDSRQDRR